MALPHGTHRLGPENGTLTVHTRRTGAAAKAGHDLDIVVTAWEATIDTGDATRMELTADGGSLRVQRGEGGVQKLGDDDKENISKTLDDEILGRRAITFRSTAVEVDGDAYAVRGDLALGDKATQEVAFELLAGDDGALRATAVVTQSGWGMKPYSILFGSLKVVDEVEVRLDVKL